MKKSTASFVLGLLSVAAFFAIPRWEGFIVSASHSMVMGILFGAIALSILGGASAFLLGGIALKGIPADSGQKRALYFARTGRNSGIVGFALGLMGAMRRRNRRHGHLDPFRQVGCRPSSV
jgi:hypothetical protein